MNVLSLFDGISAGRLALDRAGIKYDNYFASEIDKYAIKVAQTNYPDTIQLGNIENWREWNLPQVDLIIGGSPCQGFSFCGKQLNFEDPRSRLFFEFSAILKFYSPKYFLFENVRMKKEYEDVITDELKVTPIKINSSSFSAQLRSRVYWTNIIICEIPQNSDVLLNDILEYGEADREKSLCLLASYAEKTANPPDVLRYIKRSIGQLIPSTDSVSGYRKLTVKEASRLQTVPDSFLENVNIPEKEKYRQLGNGWTVDVIAHIFKNI